MLFTFLAIVTGSQQLLLLPNDRHPESDDDFETATAMESEDGYDGKVKETEMKHLQAVIDRLRDTRCDDRPNRILVFALQAPFVLLTLGVIAFLAGLGSVVFAPLANRPVWGDDAKIALLFSIAGFLCICIFFCASFLVHGLFSLQTSPTPWLIARLQNIQANNLSKV